MTPLTPRQNEVLTFIKQFIARWGYAPSLHEIRRGLGLSAIATVHKHLENLKAKGVIRRSWNRARQLEIVAPFTCPTCGHATTLDLSPTSIQNGRKVVSYKAGEPAVGAVDPP